MSKKSANLQIELEYYYRRENHAKIVERSDGRYSIEVVSGISQDGFSYSLLTDPSTDEVAIWEDEAQAKEFRNKALGLSKTTIVHDKELFELEITDRIIKRRLMEAIDVITRDGQPDILFAVVESYVEPHVYYSNGKTYSRYKDAFAAIGAAIDKANPEHNPLCDKWKS